MTNKSYNDKLNDSKDMPKLVDLSAKPDFVARVGGPLMLIAPPLAYNDIMARVPEGKIITSDRIRDYLAKQADANTTCSLTAGIFINICANASFEREEDQIPYWRTLKSKGQLNEKFPEGTDGQKALLEMEGHKVVKKGNKYFLKDYEKYLWEIE